MNQSVSYTPGLSLTLSSLSMALAKSATEMSAPPRPPMAEKLARSAAPASAARVSTYIGPQFQPKETLRSTQQKARTPLNALASLAAGKGRIARSFTSPARMPRSRASSTASIPAPVMPPTVTTATSASSMRYSLSTPP